MIITNVLLITWLGLRPQKSEFSIFSAEKCHQKKSLSTHPLCHFQTHINSRYQLSSRLSSASWRPQKSGNLGWRYGDTMGKNADPEVSWKKMSLQKKTISFGVRDERNRRFTSRLVQPWSNHWTDFWCFTETPRAKIAIKSRGGRQQMFPSSNSGSWKLYFVGWKFDMNKWNGHWTIPNWDVFGFLTNANNMFTFNQPKFDFYQQLYPMFR